MHSLVPSWMQILHEKLAQGERIREILKQPQYQPMPVENQVMIIYAATKKYLIDIPVEKILDFEKALFEYVDTKYPEVPEAIRTEKVISDETEAKLVKAIEECKADFINSRRREVFAYGLNEGH